MKTIKILFLIMAYATFTYNGMSQDTPAKANKKTKKIEIQTSAQCKICKDRIEKDMAFEKGVKSVNLDLNTKVLSIEYRIGKTNPDRLRAAISKIGYDADDVAADEKAYDKLPDCCKKGGHD
jgi:cation transport ATPase